MIDFNSPNRCDFIGYLNDKVSLSETETGTKFANFELDVVRYFEKKDGIKGKERVKINCEIWDSAAEFLSTNTDKGVRVWITSSLRLKEDKPVFRVNKFKVLKKNA